LMNLPVSDDHHDTSSVIVSAGSLASASAAP